MYSSISIWNAFRLSSGHLSQIFIYVAILDRFQFHLSRFSAQCAFELEFKVLSSWRMNSSWKKYKKNWDDFNCDCEQRMAMKKFLPGFLCFSDLDAHFSLAHVTKRAKRHTWETSHSKTFCSTQTYLSWNCDKIKLFILLMSLSKLTSFFSKFQLKLNTLGRIWISRNLFTFFEIALHFISFSWHF